MSDLDYQYLAKLVVQARDGDSNAFAELYAATFQKQYRFAYHFLGDEYLAQDALQEIYILVLKNLKKLQDPRLFVSWLNKISFHVCFQMKNKLTQYQNSESGDDCLPLYDLQAADDPEAQLINRDTKKDLMDKVMQLPPVESQVVIMKYYQGMKLEHIALAMDISRSTVNRHLASARKKLKRLLQH